MKKILFIISILFITLTSCKDINTPVREHQREVGYEVVDRTKIYNVPFDGWVSSITSFKYRGHSYIYFAHQKGGGLIHDPDCPCHKDHPKEVEEVTEY